ncbi:MAG: ATP-binding protein [Sulfuricellaceae bacterium]|jgi:nitrogen fixation/metabolism regulation signal transduction histidine kinase
MRYVAIASAVLGAVLLGLLASAGGNTDFFSKNYPLLLGLNLALALGLALLIGFQIRLLLRKIRARIFGARLTLRLLVLFGLLAVLPGTLVYGMSLQFLSKNIESWFDVRVDNALEGGLNLGRTALEYLLRDLSKKGETMAVALSDLPLDAHGANLNALREQSGVQEALLLNAKGGVVAYAGNERAGMLPEVPSVSVLRQVRMQKPYSVIESIPGRGLFMRVVVPVNVLSLTEDIRILQLLQPVPAKLSQDAETVEAVYRDYQALSLARVGLKRISGLTLTLTLLLALLSAVSLAFVLSERMSAPLGILARGTRAVAKGDFSAMPEVQSWDELGMLTQSFNTMTRELAEARAQTEFNQRQMEAAKIYLESILAHLSSGVLTFDGKLRLSTVNLSAGVILGVDLGRLRGLKLADWGMREEELAAFAGNLARHLEQNSAKDWQEQMEYASKGVTHLLLVRGSRLPMEVEGGYIVVFDEITGLIQAQRDAAWGEVARRLAHEIKNPLTPIQLSAERLEHKLADKLGESDGEMLRRSTTTIVNQVAALKKMVDAFSEYARSPQLNLQAVDLNQLVQEVATLYEPAGQKLELELAEGLPIVEGDITLLRQVIHNLLKNAQEAVAEQAEPRIEVQTEVLENNRVKLSIRDNGSGFPEALLARLCEPYVTTKPKGTGLGLAIVKKIVEEHRGSLATENLKPHGACVCVVLPIAGKKET